MFIPIQILIPKERDQANPVWEEAMRLLVYLASIYAVVSHPEANDKTRRQERFQALYWRHSWGLDPFSRLLASTTPLRM